MQKIIHTRASRVMTTLLRELRERSGLKQEELAVRIGAFRATVSAIERGERMLLALELWIYLRPLGVSPPQFVAMLDERLAAEDATPDAESMPG